MKSSVQDLRKRGMAAEEDYNDYSDLGENEVIDSFLRSEEAHVRTAAAREIACRFSETEVINLLLHHGLKAEKNLYTKIEICNGLAKQGVMTAKALCEVLGEIGNNQYKTLPESCSKKKSYPLPRDIAARTLAKMNSEVLPVILAVLESGDENKISEAIDAIGFMLFYSREFATEEVLEKILTANKKYVQNKIIQWKIITCLSAFNLPQSKAVLNTIIVTPDSDALFKAEAERSLKLLAKV